MFGSDVISLSVSQYTDVANGVMVLRVNAATVRQVSSNDPLTGFELLALEFEFSGCVKPWILFVMMHLCTHTSYTFILETSKSCEVQKHSLKL